MQKKNYQKNTVALDSPIRPKKQKGITLIALIITIIVILILVAVSVRTISKSGLFDHAKDATQKWSDAQNAEANINIDDYVDEINSPRFQKVSAGYEHCLLLDADGNIWSFGKNWDGKLGDGTTKNKSIPQKLTELGSTFKEISSGSNHSVALDVNGNIWSWGSNMDGKLGDGTTEDKAIPQKLAGLGTTFKEISAGSYHTIALDIDGNIWTWGDNDEGQLGNGTTENKLTPQKLTGLSTTFKEISAGHDYTVALDIDGNIWVWGYNRYGQLGNGATDNKLTPQKLTSLGTTFKKISTGYTHTIALDIDGNIWSCGRNDHGQLGDGTTDNKSTLEKLTGLENTFEKISAASGYSIAIDTNGNIWSWGANWSGELGNGTSAASLTPQKVTVLEISFKEISAFDGSLALDKNGILYCAGGEYSRITQTNNNSSSISWSTLSPEETYLAIELNPNIFTKWNKKITFVKKESSNYLDKENVVWILPDPI